MDRKKIMHILVCALTLQITVSLRADWFDSLGQWMSSSDNQKKSVLALATIGIGYFIYRCWKKQPIAKNNFSRSRSWSVDSDSDHEPRFSQPNIKRSAEESRTRTDSGAGLGLPFPERSRE